MPPSVIEPKIVGEKSPAVNYPELLDRSRFSLLSPTTSLKEGFMNINTLRVFAVLAATSICTGAANAQENQAKDISVIESSISCRPDVVNGQGVCAGFVEIKAIVDGKTYRMASGRAKDGLLELGSYKAVERDEPRRVPYRFKKSFELIYPDGSKEVFSVIGELK